MANAEPQVAPQVEYQVPTCCRFHKGSLWLLAGFILLALIITAVWHNDFLNLTCFQYLLWVYYGGGILGVTVYLVTENDPSPSKDQKKEVKGQKKEVRKKETEDALPPFNCHRDMAVIFQQSASLSFFYYLYASLYRPFLIEATDYFVTIMLALVMWAMYLVAPFFFGYLKKLEEWMNCADPLEGEEHEE